MFTCSREVGPVTDEESRRDTRSRLRSVKPLTEQTTLPETRLRSVGVHPAEPPFRSDVSRGEPEADGLTHSRICKYFPRRLTRFPRCLQRRRAVLTLFRVALWPRAEFVYRIGSGDCAIPRRNAASLPSTVYYTALSRYPARYRDRESYTPTFVIDFRSRRSFEE